MECNKLQGDGTKTLSGGFTCEAVFEIVADNIFTYLQYNDLLRGRLVSKSWQKIINSTQGNKFQLSLGNADFTHDSPMVLFMLKHPTLFSHLHLNSVNFDTQFTPKMYNVWKQLAGTIKSLKITNALIDGRILSEILDATSNVTELNMKAVQIFNQIPEEFENILSFSCDYNPEEKTSIGLIEFCANSLSKLQRFSIGPEPGFRNYETRVDVQQWLHIFYLVQQRNLHTLILDGLKLHHHCFHQLMELHQQNGFKLKELVVRQSMSEPSDVRDHEYLEHVVNMRSSLRNFLQTQNTLDTLVLDGLHLANEDLAIIMPNLPILRNLELILHTSKLGSDKNQEWLPYLQNLESLTIESEIMHFDVLQSIVFPDPNNKLRKLKFVGKYDPERGLEFFISIGNLRQLRHLSLESTHSHIKDEELQLILKNLPHPELMETFELIAADITDSSVMGTSQSENNIPLSAFCNLKTLNVESMSGVTNASVEVLSQLSRLETFYLHEAKIDDAGLIRLASHLPLITKFTATHCRNIQDETIAEIKTNWEFFKKAAPIVDDDFADCYSY